MYVTLTIRVFHGAPHVAMLFAPDTAEARLAADVGMYAQTLLLALTARGVASCPQGLLSFDADTVRDVLGVRGGKHGPTGPAGHRTSAAGRGRRRRGPVVR